MGREFGKSGAWLGIEEGARHRPQLPVKFNFELIAFKRRELAAFLVEVSPGVGATRAFARIFDREAVEYECDGLIGWGFTCTGTSDQFTPASGQTQKRRRTALAHFNFELKWAV